jgi:hypothetical protein
MWMKDTYRYVAPGAITQDIASRVAVTTLGLNHVNLRKVF